MGAERQGKSLGPLGIFTRFRVSIARGKRWEEMVSAELTVFGSRVYVRAQGQERIICESKGGAQLEPLTPKGNVSEICCFRASPSQPSTKS